MHGIMDSYETMAPLVANIQQATNGTPVLALNLFNGLWSTENMWYQVNTVIEAMKELPAAFDGGYICMGFSQGTLVMRGVIESWADHKCEKFISLSGPLMGQFGDTSYLQFFYPDYTRDTLYEVFYNSFVESHFSVADYWKDPHHIDLYRQVNNFLAWLNNENGTTINTNYTKNFLKLKQIVLLGGPDDGVITPWESSQFGFYDSNLVVVPMKGQDVWKKDLFGLRTLVDRGTADCPGIVNCVVSGIEHSSWYSSDDVFKQCIEPHLIDDC